MDSISLDELKEFESSVKKDIIVKYNSVLPKEKVDFVLQKEYVTEESQKKNKNKKKNYGELIRSIFTDLINPNDNSDLIHSLVEYYTMNFAEENNIEINDRPDLKGKLKVIIKEEKKLGNDLNMMAFNDMYSNLLDNVEKNSKKIPNVKLVYKNNEQYIEFVDENNKKHSEKSNNPKKTSSLYKKLIKNNVDPKEIFNQLTNIPSDNQTISEEINMLDFISNNNTNNSIDNSFEEINNEISDNFDEILEESQPLTNDDVKDENNELSMPAEFDNYNYEKIHENEELDIEKETIENNEIQNEINETDIVENDEYDNSSTSIETIDDLDNLDDSNHTENNTYYETIEKETDEYNVEESNLEDIKSFRETLDTTENKDEEFEKEEDNRKNDIYMIFYIFAVIVSIALIIGIIFLKFYS